MTTLDVTQRSLADQLLEGLTDLQRDAVTHEAGPLLILAGAGTGKTAVIARRIGWLIATGRAKAEEILALTFTEKAAAEMEERVDLLLPYGYTAVTISTFHAFGDRFLREHALEAGLAPEIRLLSKQEQLVFLRDRLFELPLRRFRPLQDPARYVQAIATVFGRAKDEAVSVDEFLAYAQALRERAAERPDDTVLRAQAEQVTELAECYDAYQRLMQQASAVDFGDQILRTIELLRDHPNVLEAARRRYRCILIDEFQDTNYAQFLLLQHLAAPTANIAVVADDDQCLPAGTPVATPDGSVPIETVQVGHEVLTAVGKGHVGSAKVTRVFRSTKPVRLLTFTTRSGRTVQVTDNHKMFCYIPSIATRKDIHYTYLMDRRDVGWRLGMTNDLATRLRLERSADRIVGLRAFNSETDARFHETLWSLTYGIPTTVFKAQPGIAIHSDLMRRLHTALDTDARAQRLAEDLRIDLRAHHACLNGVLRGAQRRVKVNLSMCARRYRAKHAAAGAIMKRPSILHTVRIHTSDVAAVEALRAANIPLHPANFGMTVRLAFADLREAGAVAERLARIVGGVLETTFDVGRWNQEHVPALLMPAKNILRGQYLPIFDRDRACITYDEVVEITETQRTQEVFDLEIERAHNFIANGVVVHNSIYKWRGAAISNVLKFLEHYHRVRRVVLTQNFRSSQPILDAAYRLIRFNDPDRLEVKERIDKRLVAMQAREPIEPVMAMFDTASSEADWVARQIQSQIESGRRRPGDFAILVRTNREADLFLRALNVCGIPWSFSGTSGVFSRDEGKLLLSCLKTLADPEDSLSAYHVVSSTLYGCPMDDLMRCLAHGRNTHESLRGVFRRVLGTATDDGQDGAPTVSDAGRQVIARFMADVDQLTEQARTQSPGQLLYQWLTDSGWLKRYGSLERADDVERLSIVAKFFDQLHRFEGLVGNRLAELMDSWVFFQTFTDAVGEPDPVAADRVNILTIHKAKGLEFPVVFLVGLVQGRFPTTGRRDPIELPEALIKDILPVGDYHLQEERRLFYVGMTRAKEELYLTAAYDYGGRSVRKLSQFVLEALNVRTPSPAPQVASLKDRLARAQTPVHETATPASVALPEPLRIDPHGLDDYLTCPLKFRYSHVLRVPIMRHHLVIYGSALHKAVEVFFTRVLQGRPMSEDALLRVFDEAWSSQGFLSREHEQQRLARGKEVLRRFYAQQRERPEHPSMIEEKFSFTLDDFVVTGRWDRVDQFDDEVVIIDYKSSDVADQDQADRRARESLQLAVYALAWRATHGRLPDRVELRFLETGVTGRATFTETDVERITERLREAVGGIRALDFHAEPDEFSCRWCAYQTICPFAAA